MKKIGIIGINEGNGHPYSMSAMFNGYDPKALNDLCPFKLIKEYLPRDHRNEFLINDAKVTHVWTQNEKESFKISKVSKIPNIVPNYLDLIGKVDAVIIARDDIENHLKKYKYQVKCIQDNKFLKILIKKNYNSEKIKEIIFNLCNINKEYIYISKVKKFITTSYFK